MQSLWFSLWNIVRWLETSKDMRFCAFADRGIKNFSCWMKMKFLRCHKKMGVSRNFGDRGIWDFSSWIKMKFFWLELYRWSTKVGWCDERERMPQMWDTSFAIGSLGRFHIMEVVCGQGTSWLLKFCQIYIFVMKGKGRGQPNMWDASTEINNADSAYFTNEILGTSCALFICAR